LLLPTEGPLEIKMDNHFISGKQIQERPNLVDAAFGRPNGNPAMNNEMFSFAPQRER